MDLGLRDKVALVTGSSQGIGRAIAESFGREGADVAVTFCNRSDKAGEVVESIRETGGEAFAVHLDLSSHESIRAAVESVVSKWGGIDILVNNAIDWGPRLPTQVVEFERMPAAEWQQQLRTNLDGSYAVIQAVLPSMRSRGWGRIVNISSGIAVDGMPGASWYAATKAAMHGFWGCWEIIKAPGIT